MENKVGTKLYFPWQSSSSKVHKGLVNSNEELKFNGRRDFWGSCLKICQAEDSSSIEFLVKGFLMHVENCARV